MQDCQHTLFKPFEITGIGLHTGKKATLRFLPANLDTAYVFVRTDLDQQPEIVCSPDHVVDTSRGTTLAQNGAIVYTVEHVLAALAGNGIDNCRIEIDGPEPPILDGSSGPYSQAISKAGKLNQECPRNYIHLDKEIRFEDSARGVELIAKPADHFSLTVEIDYNSTVLLPQTAVLERMEDFPVDIAHCRTFVFLHELEALADAGLIRGGQLENAIVLVDKPISQAEVKRIAARFNEPRITEVNQGVLNNTQLHFQNEPARHKLLDVIGDLALLGRPLKAAIFARRPGHKANTELAKQISEYISPSLKINS